MGEVNYRSLSEVVSKFYVRFTSYLPLISVALEGLPFNLLTFTVTVIINHITIPSVLCTLSFISTTPTGVSKIQQNVQIIYVLCKKTIINHDQL